MLSNRVNSSEHPKTGALAVSLVDLRAQYLQLQKPINAAIARVLRRGHYIMGPEVEELEHRLAAFVGANHCITCSSGTQALLMALMALEIEPGDEVITTAFSFVAAAEMVALMGATPVLVDIDQDSFNLDPAQVEEAISPRTRLILPVSLFGHPFDADALGAIAERHAVPILEDAAQSLGATYKGRSSCHLSRLAATSFYPTKPLGCYGDGGALFTDDSSLADKLRSIRMHGMGAERYEHARIGLNGRLDTLQAAVLLAKLAGFPSDIKARQSASASYDALLAEVPGLQLPKAMADCVSVWASYTVRVPERDRIRRRLELSGIATEVYYPLPLNRQPGLAEICKVSGSLGHSERAARTVLSLPLWPGISPAQQQQVSSALRSALADIISKRRAEKA